MIRAGIRKKQGDELTPQFEVWELRHTGNPIQVCWDFKEYTFEDNPEPDFKFKYVTVADLQPQTLQDAGVPQNIIDLCT